MDESNSTSFNLGDSSMDTGDNIGDNAVRVETVSGKRKMTSSAWKNFNRIMIDGVQHGECKHCGVRLKVPSKNGTSSLHKHNKLSCKKTGIRQSPSMTNKKVVGSQEPFNEEETRLALAKMVVRHDYPLSIVEHDGFRQFVDCFKTSFQMMSRNTLKKDIMNLYDDERVKCYNSLEKLKCRIAITTDMWTSGNSKRGYMAITGHYIDDSWVLQSCILRFIYVPAPHTAETLSSHLLKTLKEWNIDRRLSTITVDNCTTNDAMIERLLEKLQTRDLPLNGKVLHMRCSAHILNLIVKDGLGVINDAIERIRDCVVYWTASPARVEKFEDCARRLNIGSTKKLSIDCKTRWNSTFLMLETAIVYKDVFPRIIHREKYYKDLPTYEDWENASEICDKLKFFYIATEMFSGTLYPTSNFYFSNICDIKISLHEWVNSPKQMIQDMSRKMLVKYDKYWDTCHVMMGVAAVLDPRYKMQLVEYYFEHIYGERSQPKIDEIRHNCYQLLSDYQSRVSSMRSDSSSTRGSLGSMVRSGLSTSSSSGLVGYDRFVASRSTTSTSLTSELDLYLEESVLPRTETFDVLIWWKVNGSKYPTLQNMARDILAIPVSTVASESAFSTSGRLLSPHRNRLNPSIVEALMCTRGWLWKETNGTCLTFGDLSVCPTILDEEEVEDEQEEEHDLGI